MNSIRAAILQRLKDRLRNKDFRTRYEKWTHDFTTQEVAGMLRDCLCRPTAIELPCDQLADAAILAQGVSEGSWQFYDAMLNLHSLPENPPEPEMDYGAEHLEEKESKYKQEGEK